MKINNIILNNFGSYEGETVFNTRIKDNRNIILIGGKNGAGKTTLFMAIRICLYGYMSMGYKSQNVYYSRAITKMINNNAKMTRPAQASVSIEISLSNGQGLDQYVLKRSWVLGDTLLEQFEIKKNGNLLETDEVADFEKYLLSLIPPELFNLYFFDGEKIADFFLDEGSNTRIKDAFLTLCGYDTFDIMRKNFKRISSSEIKNSDTLDQYLSKKEELLSEKSILEDLENEHIICIDNLSNCESEIKTLEKEYYQKGGITEEEWNKKLLIIKEEEKKRESYNAYLKKCANDIIPFVMIRDQLIALKEQIEKENRNIKYKNFCDVLDLPEISNIIFEQSDKLKGIAFKVFGSDSLTILDLSFEKSAEILSQINKLIEFDVSKIANCKKAIKFSINKSAKIRKELDEKSTSTVKEYMQKRADLYELKSKLLLNQMELEQKITLQKETVINSENQFSKIQSQLEEELKKVSINDISARAILMLDKLQKNLFLKQIKKVEEFFRVEINSLMRKNHFIDDIKIDDNFYTHIYRYENITINKLREIISTNTKEQVKLLLGEAAIIKLESIAEENKYNDSLNFINNTNLNEIKLPLEIDKSSLSNGEKQIFIMALYHSLISLCNHEVPFIIDTPFARIDTEHRINISKHFFSKLNGQIFILSTNEEIDTDHVQILKDNIAHTYMLENTDNKRTVVVQNSYFEV